MGLPLTSNFQKGLLGQKRFGRGRREDRAQSGARVPRCIAVPCCVRQAATRVPPAWLAHSLPRHRCWKEGGTTDRIWWYWARTCIRLIGDNQFVDTVSGL